jgi:hypothetical protein
MIACFFLTKIKYSKTNLALVFMLNKKVGLVVAALLLSIVLLPVLNAAANPIGAMYPSDPQNKITIYPFRLDSDYYVRVYVDLTDWKLGMPQINPTYTFTSNINYYLDNQQLSHETTSQGQILERIFKINSVGEHTIKVEVTSQGTYWKNNGGVMKECNDPVYNNAIKTFTVTSSSPTISILSPENGNVYEGNKISLNITIDRTYSKAAYQLDNFDNATIMGNTTLPSMQLGAHNLTVYVWEMLTHKLLTSQQ